MPARRPETVPCECADALNFGEPQPDCSACAGSGRRPKDRAAPGGTFTDREKPTRVEKKKR